ncbi:hypothetical protein [Catenulispora subtropica]|uniref:TetR/AcrR family transcriptional regulator n=1 Tax=Catenulispora subtropica TaxID=450798 RepID=A0ABP5D397_9ACTN
MATRTDWLDAGLDVLAAHGHPALIEDRVAMRLGVDPKEGSFCEHFGDEAGFHEALLTHAEACYTNAYITRADPSGPGEDSGLTPQDRLGRLADAVLSDGARPDLEVAMRSWARHHAAAGVMQERIDRRRVDYVRGLIAEATGDLEHAERLARLMYLVLVGARQVVPSASNSELREYFGLAMAAIRAGDAPQPS